MTDDKGKINLQISYNIKLYQSGQINNITSHVTDLIIIKFQDIIKKY